MENLVRDIRMSLAAGMRVCLPGLGVFTVERQAADMRSGVVYPPGLRTVFIADFSDKQPDGNISTNASAQDELSQEIHRQMSAGSCFRIAGWGTFVREAQTARYVLEDAREELLAFPTVQLPDVQDEAEVTFEPVFTESPEAEGSPSEPVRLVTPQPEPPRQVTSQPEPPQQETPQPVASQPEPSQPEPSRPELPQPQSSQPESTRPEPSQAKSQPPVSPPASSPVAHTPPAPTGSVWSRRPSVQAPIRRRKRRTQWLLLPGLLLLLAAMAGLAYFAYLYLNPPSRPEVLLSGSAGGSTTTSSPAPVAATPAAEPSAVLSDRTGIGDVSAEQPGVPSVQPSAPEASAPSADSASSAPSVADGLQQAGDTTPDLTVYEPESTSRYYVVVGSLTSESQAVSQIQTMSRAGGRGLRIVRFDTSLYRLVAGGCATYSEASALLEEVKAYAPKAWIFQHR